MANKLKPSEFTACLLVLKDGTRIRGYAKWDEAQRQYIYTADVADLPARMRATLPTTTKQIAAVSNGNDLFFDKQTDIAQ